MRMYETLRGQVAYLTLDKQTGEVLPDDTVFDWRKHDIRRFHGAELNDFILAALALALTRFAAA